MGITIMGLAVDARAKKAPEVQEVLTKYGCIIKTRLGMHEVSEDRCSQEGIIILTISGKGEEIQSLKGELEIIDGVRVNMMIV